MRRRLHLVAAVLAATFALAGCGFKGAYSLPLPGGNAGGSAYTVTAYFDDVQDLVPMSAVRVDDIAVGDVTDIRYDPARDKARVTMRIKRSVQLPTNAVATLEQTTLLGEKYIALAPPADEPPVGRLSDGATLADDATSDLPDVEQVFAILSNVLNGSDLQDLQTINVEITKALQGREQSVRSALRQLDRFVGNLDSQKQQIVRALDSLDRFTGELAKQNSTIADALDHLHPGLKVLADERVQFTRLLSDLSKFGVVATRIITASREQTVAGLRDLKPILAHLRAAGTNLPHSLELLITYPFPKNIDRAIPGDYNGLRLSFNADPVFCDIVTMAGLTLPTCPKAATFTLPRGTAPGAGSPAPSPKPSLPTILPIPSLPPAPSLPGGSDPIGQLLRQGLGGAA